MKTEQEIRTQLISLEQQRKRVVDHVQQLEQALDQNRQLLIAVDASITMLRDVLGEPNGSEPRDVSVNAAAGTEPAPADVVRGPAEESTPA